MCQVVSPFVAAFVPLMCLFSKSSSGVCGIVVSGDVVVLCVRGDMGGVGA